MSAKSKHYLRVKYIYDYICGKKRPKIQLIKKTIRSTRKWKTTDWCLKAASFHWKEPLKRQIWKSLLFQKECETEKQVKNIHFQKYVSETNIHSCF